MTFAGIDYSSTAIDVVRLELDSDAARWDRILLDSTGKLETIDRARRIRDLLPSRRAWADDGVVCIGIELSMTRMFSSAVSLSRVQGAILACLPPPGADPPVLYLPAYEWKKAFGLSGNANKRGVRAAVLERWPNLPTNCGQDALDAYAIAWAAREICAQAAAA